MDDLRARIAGALGQLRFGLDAKARYGLSGREVEEATEQLLPFVEAELGQLAAAMEALTAQSATALAKRDKAKQRARIAEAELEALRGGLREIGGDPSQVQNLYAQLSSRTRQWKAAEATLQAVREAQSLGDALAAVAKHDGITTQPITTEESPS